MIVIRDRDSRGRTKIDWLDSRHSFSFADYVDPNHMGFRSLRVINDDRVIPGGGFGTHGHRDMEIVSYVLSGALEHKDSMGSGAVIRHGEVQHMSAGTGVTHSEFNHSKEEPVHFLQIWILPEREGIKPVYEQKKFPSEGRSGRFQLIGDRHGTAGALTIRQDVRIYAAELAEGQEISQDLAEGRYAWLHVASGAVTIEGNELRDGDGAAISDEPSIRLATDVGAEVLLFDMA